MRDRLTAELTTAMKRRDRVAVSALRSILAAIDNAGATPPSAHRRAPADLSDADLPTAASSEYVAGASLGLGATEVERRDVSAGEVQHLLQAQVAERERAADEFSRLGRNERAEQLRAEADVLRVFLRPHPGPADDG